jgi:hypothetical protein
MMRVPTAADETQARLQDAARVGLPVMIPGEFEPRSDRSRASSTDGAPRVTAPLPTIAAPRRTPLDRVWRYLMRPTDTPPM